MVGRNLSAPSNALGPFVIAMAPHTRPLKVGVVLLAAEVDGIDPA
jgi:hypothetical protein